MTAQLPESIQINGQRHLLLSLPLQTYFLRSGNWPLLLCGGTALARGYIGQWEVIDDRLYLIAVHGQQADGSPLALDQLFPGFPDRVFAHWFSGELRVGMGAQTLYVHQGFQSRYERELIMDVRRGVVVGERLIAPVPGAIDPGPKALWQ